MRRSPTAAVFSVVAILLAGCASDDGQGGQVTQDATPASPASPAAQDEQRYPDVLDVTVERTDGTFSFSVTISSPYDTPERYADGWRLVGPDGTVYAEHTLMHDHADEQPFTRTQAGVQIPAGVPQVTVEARDKRYGYGGTTMVAPVPHER